MQLVPKQILSMQRYLRGSISIAVAAGFFSCGQTGQTSREGHASLTVAASDLGDFDKNLPFPELGCRSELRQQAKDHELDKLIQRVDQTRGHLDDIPVGLLGNLFLDNDFVASVKKFHQDVDTAYTDFNLAMTQSPCLPVVAKAHKIELKTLKQQLNQPEREKGDEALKQRMDDAKEKAASYEPPRRKYPNTDVPWFMPATISTGSDDVNTYKTPLQDFPRRFNVNTINIIADQTDQERVLRLAATQGVLKKYAKEVGYFGAWEEPEAFEQQWSEHFLSLRQELKKCGMYFENERRDGQALSFHAGSENTGINHNNPSALQENFSSLVSRTSELQVAAGAGCDGDAVQAVIKRRALLLSVVLAEAAGKAHLEKDAAASELLALSREVLKIAVDVGTGSLPVVGTGRALVEAVVGFSLVPDFEELSTAERAFGVVLSTPGLKVLQKSTSYVKKTKVVESILGKLDSLVKRDKTLFDKVADSSIDLAARAQDILDKTPQLKNAWSSEFKIAKIQHAEEMNKKLAAELTYTEPAFKADTHVMSVVLKSEQKFVRVFREGSSSNPQGRWMTRESEIKGLTPLEVKEKFNLPNEPTHFVYVTVPQNAEIMIGVGGANAFGGNESVAQFFHLKPDFAWFGETHKL